MIKIFDSHSHIPFDYAGMQDFICQHTGNNVKSGIVMAMPFINEMICPFDKKHYTCVRQGYDGRDEIFCTNCNKRISQATNIYRQYNVMTINLVELINRKYGTRFYPFITSIVSERMLKSELDYFSSNYANRFFGLKIYTGLSFDVLNNIHFNANIPLLIHTGTYFNQQPKNMLNFLLNYDGPVCLAHFARIDIESIRVLSEKNNLYLDSSPASRLSEVCSRNEALAKNITTPKDLYYKILNVIGTKKLLWGSDAPYGNVATELKLFHELNLSLEEKFDILYNNALRFLSLAP